MIDSLIQVYDAHLITFFITCLQTNNDINIESYKSDVQSFSETAHEYDKYRYKCYIVPHF